MEVIKALIRAYRNKDNTPTERLEYNRVRATIEAYCEEYLMDVNQILKFEALPSAIDATLAYLDSKQFNEKYEFQQVSETIFLVKLRVLDIL